MGHRAPEPWVLVLALPSLRVTPGVAELWGFCLHKSGLDVSPSVIRGSPCPSYASVYLKCTCEQWPGGDVHVASQRTQSPQGPQMTNTKPHLPATAVCSICTPGSEVLGPPATHGTFPHQPFKSWVLPSPVSRHYDVQSNIFSCVE